MLDLKTQKIPMVTAMRLTMSRDMKKNLKANSKENMTMVKTTSIEGT